ncbi:hypothetical protein F2P56_037063 [Juglans regia]|uniref:Zinc finger BED domain-containing protein RICESLEEPER 2-like n=1 Tax=Juglans regia TaxID=51240 RepID=A0A833X5A6_JUGRE|nr:hypothetical protein F2P56_037063 [Juglans regia]
MCLTAHLIDCEWKLYKKIINFCLIPNHNGDTIGKHVESCLQDWGIDKILTVTVDNASSNDVAIDYLKRFVGGHLLEGKYIHIRTVEALVCTHNWLKDPVHIDLRASLDNVESFEAESEFDPKSSFIYVDEE